MTHPFHIMAKPVGGLCNFDCAYCYYKDKPRELYADGQAGAMSPEVLESFTRQYLSAMPERCEFSWQGGEPMLAGLDFYRCALQCQDRSRARVKPSSTASRPTAHCWTMSGASFWPSGSFSSA